MGHFFILFFNQSLVPLAQRYSAQLHYWAKFYLLVIRRAATRKHATIAQVYHISTLQHLLAGADYFHTARNSFISHGIFFPKAVFCSVASTLHSYTTYTHTHSSLNTCEANVWNYKRPETTPGPLLFLRLFTFLNSLYSSSSSLRVELLL